MSRGPRRKLIPPSYQETMAIWPRPDEASLSNEDPYFNRKKAVTMYAMGASHNDIQAETGVRDKECRRLAGRCVQYCPTTGQIYGFTALIHGKRIKSYERSRPITTNDNGQLGGCSGAMTMLFERYPEVQIFVDELFLKKRSKDEGNANEKPMKGKRKVHEARIPIQNLHGLFIGMLRELGFTDEDWPFNTANRGYNALRNYCKALRENDPDSAMQARSGIQAKQRSGVGNGKGRESLIQALRPYSVVQLDFHKVDAACTIVIENAYGVDLELPVARWHIGMLIDEQPKSILGLYISLEKTPSADCVLETIESALRPESIELADPRWKFAQDGKVLIYQFVPQLEWQCFSVIKMDNAWSNVAHDVVNNILSTVGCAVNFGPVRAWWRRPLIERMFGCLESIGLKRLPSTYGSGVTDTRRDDPQGQAVEHKIRLSDVVAQIFGAAKSLNSKPGEGVFWASPVQAIEAMLARPRSGLFATPLPKAAQQDLMLMKHIEEVVVRGDIDKNRTPYIKSDRCEYRNERLSRSYSLIGKKLLIYIDRRDIRIVSAVIKDTGENLGMLHPEMKWRKTRCTWRMRKWLNRSGFANKYKDESVDPINQCMGETAEKLIQKNTKGTDKKAVKGMHSATQSLALAKMVVNATKPLPAETHQDPLPETAPVAAPNPVTRKRLADPFNLGSQPSRINPNREID